MLKEVVMWEVEGVVEMVMTGAGGELGYLWEEGGLSLILDWGVGEEGLAVKTCCKKCSTFTQNFSFDQLIRAGFHDRLSKYPGIAKKGNRVSNAYLCLVVAVGTAHRRPSGLGAPSSSV